MQSLLISRFLRNLTPAFLLSFFLLMGASPGLNFARADEKPSSFAMTEKPSLKALGSQLKESPAITQLFKDSRDLLKAGGAPATSTAMLGKIDSLWKLNESTMSTWLSDNRESRPFTRGEVDEEAVMSQVLAAVQLSILRARGDAFHAQYAQVRSGLDPWFIFASDLTYEEASLISLRLANVIRSLLLDELENIENLSSKQFSAADLELWSSWVGSIRSSWPIDRILLTEAKKILGDKMMFTARQMAMALQKNAYQTAAVALKAAQGPKSPELKLLEKLWREEDILAMKTEVHRLAALKIRLAKDLFVKKFAQEPKTIEDLVTNNLLPMVPLDYATGKPFTLAEAALH